MFATLIVVVSSILFAIIALFRRKWWFLWLLLVVISPFLAFLPGYKWMYAGLMPFLIPQIYVLFVGLLVVRSLFGQAIFVILAGLFWIFRKKIPQKTRWYIAGFLVAMLLIMGQFFFHLDEKIIEFTRPGIFPKGEIVVNKIEEYRRQHGTYPDSLAQIGSFSIARINFDDFCYEKKDTSFSLFIDEISPFHGGENIRTVFLTPPNAEYERAKKIPGFEKWRYFIWD